MVWHTTVGDICATEQEFRLKRSGFRFRPFSESAGVRGRCYSRPLQRVVCDLGADEAFEQVARKVKEHYGITLPKSAARDITEYHASQMNGEPANSPHSAAECIIAESDGSMIPLVEPDVPEESVRLDHRKHKKLHWKEARLTLAYAKGSATPCFAGTMGSTEQVGEQLCVCVTHAGGHPRSHLHCVGDGASWIANQVENKFGANGNYLIDFYHLCEYLAKAATVCAPKQEKQWLAEQKKALKNNEVADVLNRLKPMADKERREEKEFTPALDCYRYISNRLDQFDYKRAIENDLPIGSGKIESAHRYVIQKRLKLPGAWWTPNNAKQMLKLRVTRANNEWEEYWRKAA